MVPVIAIRLTGIVLLFIASFCDPQRRLQLDSLVLHITAGPCPPTRPWRCVQISDRFRPQGHGRTADAGQNN